MCVSRGTRGGQDGGVCSGMICTYGKMGASQRCSLQAHMSAGDDDDDGDDEGVVMGGLLHKLCISEN